MENENRIQELLIKALVEKDLTEAGLLINIARSKNIEIVDYVLGHIYDFMRNDESHWRYINYRIRYTSGSKIILYDVLERDTITADIIAYSREGFIEQERTRLDWYFDLLAGEDDGGIE